jgi:small subunit ribosomal protein S4
VDIASYLLKPGDVVSVAPRPALQKQYRQILTEGLHNADWLVSDPDQLLFSVTRDPVVTEVSLPVEVSKVIELLSR